jgi:hypothetical protein
MSRDTLTSWRASVLALFGHFIRKRLGAPRLVFSSSVAIDGFDPTFLPLLFHLLTVLLPSKGRPEKVTASSETAYGAGAPRLPFSAEVSVKFHEGPIINATTTPIYSIHLTQPLFERLSSL